GGGGGVVAVAGVRAEDVLPHGFVVRAAFGGGLGQAQGGTWVVFGVADRQPAQRVESVASRRFTERFHPGVGEVAGQFAGGQLRDSAGSGGLVGVAGGAAAFGDGGVEVPVVDADRRVGQAVVRPVVGEQPGDLPAGRGAEGSA